MNTSTCCSAGGVLFRSTILSALILLGLRGELLPHAQSAEDPDDAHGILRFDPVNNALAPVSQGELKPGYIYNHFSRRLNRRVWSYVQANGEFWYALGEGTTQEAWRLDIRATQQEAIEKLAENYPELAREVTYRGVRVFVRLNADNRWVVAGTATHPTIYNLETGARWQRVAVFQDREAEHRWKSSRSRYIPIVHTCGSQWAVEGGKYVPMERVLGAAFPAEWSIAPTIGTDDGF